MAGRGREAVLPSWMTSNGIEAANSFNPQVSSFPSEQYHGDSAPLDAPSAPREERDRGRDRDRDRDRYCYIILLMIISSVSVYQFVSREQKYLKFGVNKNRDSYLFYIQGQRQR
jgi:hypothetical protein